MGAESVEPGENFAGRYRVEHLIGSGGFARIYRAVQHDLDRPVALKILAPNSLPSPSSRKKLRERFEREARILSRLRDPRTVTVYDFGSVGDDILYMVLEYIEGGDLSTTIREEGRLSVDRARNITVQILQSLREVHGHGVLHRDIKPSNIMLYEHLGERDNVKVLDFGVAKGLVTQELATGDLTADGAIIGTPRYMSPEQLNNVELRPASDLFGVGLVLFEMISGESPYGDGGFGDIYRRMLKFSDDVGPLEDLPSDFREVARGLLAPSLDDRFASATEALSDLGIDVEPMESSSGQAASNESDAPASFPLALDPSGATPASDISAVSSIEAAPLDTPVQERRDTAVIGSEEPHPEASTVETPSTAERTPPEDQSTADREPRSGAASVWKWLASGVVAAVVAVAAVVVTGVGGEEVGPEQTPESEATGGPNETGAGPSTAAAVDDGTEGTGRDERKKRGSERRGAARRTAVGEIAGALGAARSEAERASADTEASDREPGDESDGARSSSDGDGASPKVGPSARPDQQSAGSGSATEDRNEARSEDGEPGETPSGTDGSREASDGSTGADENEEASDDEPSFEMFDEL